MPRCAFHQPASLSHVVSCSSLADGRAAVCFCGVALVIGHAKMLWVCPRFHYFHVVMALLNTHHANKFCNTPRRQNHVELIPWQKETTLAAPFQIPFFQAFHTAIHATNSTASAQPQSAATAMHAPPTRCYTTNIRR